MKRFGRFGRYYVVHLPYYERSRIILVLLFQMRTFQLWTSCPRISLLLPLPLRHLQGMVMVSPTIPTHLIHLTLLTSVDKKNPISVAFLKFIEYFSYFQTSLASFKHSSINCSFSLHA